MAEIAYLLTKSDEYGGSGERYFYPAVAVIFELLHNGIIIKGFDGRFILSKSAKEGLEVIARMGNYILKNFYADKNSTPVNVRNYVEMVKGKI